MFFERVTRLLRRVALSKHIENKKMGSYRCFGMTPFYIWNNLLIHITNKKYYISSLYYQVINYIVKSALTVGSRQITINLSEIDDKTDSYRGTTSIDSGYTLFKNWFPVVTNTNDWIYSGQAASGVSGSHSYSFSQSGTTITVDAYRVTKITATVYYLH